MALSPGARTCLNSTGAFLGLAGLIFVGIRLHSYAGDIDFRKIGFGGFIAIAALAGLYGASNLLLAVGWRRLLAHLGVSVSHSWAIRTYATSQLAKYVPGNIFQFAGRQVLGVAAGIGHGPLAKSTAYELALLVAGGTLFSPLLLPLIVGGTYNWLGWIAFAVILAVAVWLATVLGKNFAMAAIFYIVFLAVSGLVFAAAYDLAGGSGHLTLYPEIAGAYVLAWLAGLVAPGAPAGIGVREAVLLFLLGGLSSEPVILLAVVIGRVITVLGDLSFFAGGLIAGQYKQV